jgi:hypothetical protein
MTARPELVDLVSFVERLGATPSGSAWAAEVEDEAKQLCQAALTADATADEAHDDFIMLSSMVFVRHLRHEPVTWGRTARLLARLAQQVELA